MTHPSHGKRAYSKRVLFWPARLVFVLVLVNVLWAMPAYAAASDNSLKAAITRAEKKLVENTALLKKHSPVSDEELAGLINELSTIRTDSLDSIRQLTDQRDIAKAALDQAKPADTGKPVATDPVAAAKLKSLQKQVSAIEGLLVRANLNASQADQLAQQVSALRKSLYFSTVFSRSSPPFSTEVRHRILRLSKVVVTDLGKWIAANTSGPPGHTRVLRGGLAVFSFLLLLVLASPFYGWLEGRYFLKFFSTGAEPKNNFDRRQTIAFARAAVRLSAFAVPALVVYFMLRLTGIIQSDEASMVSHSLLAVGGVVLGDAIARSCLSPVHPEFRLVSLSDRQAGNYLFFALAALWVFAFDHIMTLGYAFARMHITLEALQAQSAVVTLIAASLLSLAVIQVPLRFSLPSQGDDGSRQFRFAAPGVMLSGLHFSAILAAFVGIVASLFGYVEFGRTLIWSLILTVLVLTGFVLIRHTIKNLFSWLWVWLWAGPSTDTKKPVEPGGIIMNIWLRLLADIALVTGGLWVFLNLANFRISDLNLWVGRFFEGIPLGATVIRPTAIAWAIAAFLLVSLLFRAVRIYLRQGMQGQSEINAGANASILALVGYVGFVVALLVGFSALGLPFSNIALIASGLSLGIGFGLKDVANNFISGLILLFERPIKNGDWVVSSAGQGLVKNIGLRSTEIVTFDRASIMVPNSELVSAPLVNWTHKDKTGRTKLQVGVAYGTDPVLVRDILLECANAHESVLHRPKAVAYWINFGESSLDFELRAYTSVRGENDMTRLESDLRFAIYAAFAQHGIKIPFPQRDVHLIPAEAPGPVSRPVKKRVRRKPKTSS